jgi:hypothetical protein
MKEERQRTEKGKKAEEEFPMADIDCLSLASTRWAYPIAVL